MNLGAFITAMIASGDLMRLARDMAAQFGTPTRRYIGAEVLPERMVGQNDYMEESIKFRTVIANAGTRYSPSQKKGQALTGKFAVHLAHQDIAAEMNAQDYDAITRTLRGAGAFVGPILTTRPGMQAVATMTNWVDTVINRALIEVLEVYRWQMLCNQQVLLTGDNAYEDVVNYPKYADLHSASSDWANNANDPYLDISRAVAALAKRGTVAVRIVLPGELLAKYLSNTNIRARTGKVVVSTTGQIQGVAGRATLDEVNAMNRADGLPPFETYDLLYNTDTGMEYFLPRNKVVIFGATGRDENVDLGDTQFESLSNTLGYVGVGIAAGQPDAGRVIRVEAFDNKPPRIEAEGWQAALPVLTEPEGYATLTHP